VSDVSEPPSPNGMPDGQFIHMGALESGSETASETAAVESANAEIEYVASAIEELRVDWSAQRTGQRTRHLKASMVPPTDIEH
jgi:hypothetical protein